MPVPHSSIHRGPRSKLGCGRCSSALVDDGRLSKPRCSGVLVSLIATITLALIVASPGRAAIINLPDITVHSFGHTYTQSVNSEGGDVWTRTDRIDALGAVSSGSFSTSTPTYFGNAVSGDTIVQRFLAPPGMKFSVYRDTSFAAQSFVVRPGWTAGTDTRLRSNRARPQVTFENLAGATPVVVEGNSSLGNEGYRIQAYVKMNVISDFSFTEMRVSWTPNYTPLPPTDRTFTPFPEMGFFTTASSGNDYNAVTMAITPVPEPESGALAVGGLLLAVTDLARRRARNARNVTT